MIFSIPTVLIKENNETTVSLITKEKVKCDAFSIKAYKTLGPDGFLPAISIIFSNSIKMISLESLGTSFILGSFLGGLIKNLSF